MRDARGRLRSIALTAPDPAGAADGWARLLGGRADGARIAFADDTEVAVERGSEVGLREIRVEGRQELFAGAVELRDPDGWDFRIERAEAIGSTAPSGPMLGHLTFVSPDPLGQRDFYEEQGFALSDALGDLFCWLRCGPAHHTVAFSRGGAPALHHLAIELPDRASFVDAVDRATAAGSPIEFGPGRHLVGGNLFAYLRDPHGLRWELFCDLERIEDPDYVAPTRTAEDRRLSINVWGPPPPASFVDEAGGPGPAT